MENKKQISSKQAEAKKNLKKASFWQKLMAYLKPKKAQKDTTHWASIHPPKPTLEKPKSSAEILAVPLPKPTPKPVIKPAPAVKAEKKAVGNTFTKLFGVKKAAPKPAPSMIDTIVNKATVEKKPEQKEKKVKKPLDLAPLAKAFFRFSVAFIVLSAGFFYAQNKDINNTVLGLIDQPNVAQRLHQAANALDQKKAEASAIDKEIKRYEEGYNNQYEAIVNQIVESRLDWNDLLSKINEITNSVYEHNELSQYVQYHQFAFDEEKNSLRISGTLTDPLGKNLTKLTELEQAFRFFPKNPKNPDDKTEPYFHDVKEFTSLRKTFDKSTGRYSSSFQLSFSLKPNADQ